jgi:hypothetical protein
MMIWPLPDQRQRLRLLLLQSTTGALPSSGRGGFLERESNGVPRHDKPQAQEADTAFGQGEESITKITSKMEKLAMGSKAPTPPSDDKPSGLSPPPPPPRKDGGMVGLVRLTQYSEENEDASVYVNPEEVASVRPWKYHSFRPAISEITLRCGSTIRVWQDVERVASLFR